MSETGADQNLGRRPSALPDAPVPAVPASEGPRMMTLAYAGWALYCLGMVLLSVLVLPADLARPLGLADEDTAVVTDRTWHSPEPMSRGCSRYDFDVEWASRRGEFSACSTEDNARLEVGDRVVVVNVPWSSHVTPASEAGGWGAWVLVAVLLWVAAMSAAAARRYRRLVRGEATGVRLTGRVAKRGKRLVSVRLDTPGLEGQRLVLLPSKQRFALHDGDPVEVWASRRSVLGRRLRGPWVVGARQHLSVFTHAWFRRSAG